MNNLENPENLDEYLSEGLNEETSKLIDDVLEASAIFYK